MKAKKIPQYALIFFAVLGASLTLGFLSFGGMFVLLPILPLAICAFFLSTAYEGEINLKNIKGALTKLFKRNYLKRHLANEFLVNKFPDTSVINRPQFFVDYEKQLKLVNKLKKGSKEDKSLKKHKKQAEKTLKDMEKWFSGQLFSKDQDENQTEYAKQLTKWLQANGQQEELARYKKRKYIFHAVKIFSLTAGVFMALGTSFMIADSIVAIPLLAALLASSVFGGPLIALIAVLVVSAGVAWALLTYNTITDIINNDLVKSWINDLKKYFSQGFTLANVLRATAAILLIATTLALTIFTAGTWWTIAKAGKPFFGFIAKLPGFIMSVINPIITGISVGAFNVSNSYETLSEMTQTQSTHHDESLWSRIKSRFTQFKREENWLQRINPFRILLKIIITPLLVVLFLGHLVSISVTADRFPGISSIITAFVGFISEFFEDFHYFIPLGNHDHAHSGNKKTTQELLEERHQSEGGHEHGNDIPTQLIKFIFSPLYLLAISWDWAASKKNDNQDREQLSFIDACKKHKLFIFDYKPLCSLVSKLSKENITELPAIDNTLPTKYSSTAKQPSPGWQVEHALLHINRHEEKHFSKTFLGQAKAQTKKEKLHQLKQDIIKKPGKVEELINQASKDVAFNQHRIFNSDKPTRTTNSLRMMEQRVKNLSFPAA